VVEFLKYLVDIYAAGVSAGREPIFMRGGDGHDLTFGAADQGQGGIGANWDTNSTTHATGSVDLDIRVSRG
jgi:hypothetical protein